MQRVNKRMLIPKLRFGSFDSNWQEVKLESLTERVKRKNKSNNDNVLTISAQYGLVNQVEYFNKSVAAKDVTNYYLMRKDEFAYNRSYSKGYPMGAIKRLTMYDEGVVSTLYICFKMTEEVSSEYAEHYFESGKQNLEIAKVAQEGARNHGLLNVALNDFFSIKFRFPDVPEQQKIASFFTIIDQKIAQLTQKVEALEQYKNGVVQKLFSEEIRFKDDNGKDFPEWEKRPLGTFLKEHKERSSGKEEVFSVSVHKGLVNQVEHLGRVFAAKNTDHYNLVKPNDVVYTKSPTGDFPLGIIKQSKLNDSVIVSPLYGVFTPQSKGLGYLLDSFFESPVNTKNYLGSIVQKGAKNTINITNSTFLSKKIKLPVSIEEQEKIGSFLQTLDDKITQTKSKLEETKLWKKGLLQKMFV